MPTPIRPRHRSLLLTPPLLLPLCLLFSTAAFADAVAQASAGVCAATRATPQPELETACGLLKTGSYDEAYDRAVAVDGGTGFGVAAQALGEKLLADLDAKVARRDLQRLDKSTDKALKHAPHDLDAQLQRALYIWFESRQSSNVAGLLRGYPKAAKTLLESAVNAYPESARAQGFWGLWNIDVIRRGGDRGASMFGADVETGLRAWDRAMQLAPDDIVLATHGAQVLLAFDGEGQRARIELALRAAIDSKAQNHLDVALQQRASVLLDHLQRDEERAHTLAMLWVGQ